MEIERKFLVKKLPESLGQYKKREIEQAYLCNDPVVRVRRDNDKYYLTYKSKGFIARDIIFLLPRKHTSISLQKQMDLLSQKTVMKFLMEMVLPLNWIFLKGITKVWLSQRWNLIRWSRQIAILLLHGLAKM